MNRRWWWWYVVLQSEIETTKTNQFQVLFLHLLYLLRVCVMIIIVLSFFVLDVAAENKNSCCLSVINKLENNSFSSSAKNPLVIDSSATHRS